MERLGDDANGQNALFAGSARHNGRSTRAGAAAHAGGHEAHMGRGQVIDQFVDAFFGGGLADFRLRTGTQSLGHGSAELDQALGLGLGQRLCVGIGDDELDAPQARIDHVVDGIAAPAPDTEHGDAWLQLGNIRLLQIDSHCPRPFRLCRRLAAAVVIRGRPR